MKYRGHTIERESGGGIYELISGQAGYVIKGPHCNGGSPTMSGAKNLIDQQIKRAEEKSQTQQKGK